MDRHAVSLVVEYVREMAAAESDIPDAELLKRYAASGDADAFGLLVQRHGPMVLGVCRRVLGPTADADDAFQATFLTLMRQCRRVTDCLPGWLHRVALRTAQRGLRRNQSTPLPAETVDPADPFAVVEWRELRAILDAELACLPVRLHVPLVLCYLDGLTRDEAAKRLGWSLRTLHRRLDEGRKLLHSRLLRRGALPLILAAVTFAPEGLRAEVPSSLLRATIRMSLAGTQVPPSVQLLVPSAKMRGGVMKAIAIVLVVSAGSIGFGIFADAGAESPRVPPGSAQPTAPAVLVRVPTPKVPADPLREKVDAAKKQAIAYLRKQQNKNGDWEGGKFGPQSGGTSALVMLSLLEAGVETDDDMIKAGLKYLRTLKPTGTYMVSLQTQVFCKANQLSDAKQIMENVEWLEKAAAREHGKLLGWSYTAAPGGRADGSNTRYAIAGLYAAHKAGFEVKSNDFWTDVAALYLQSQKIDGGWGYVSVSQSTATMTGSGVVCLNWSWDILGKKEPKESKKAAEKGRIWIEDHFKIKQTQSYYFLDVLADLGSMRGERKLTDRANGIDWYREGCEWLFEEQRADGRFQGIGTEASPVISTAFALRFLSARIK